MTTGSHLPSRLAEWNLESLYYGFNYWASEYYDAEIHSALGASPREMFERGLQLSGRRVHMQIQWNESFLIATCPPVDRRGLRKVDNQRGVKVYDQHYWHPAFRDPKVVGQEFRVRYDPWDASTVYVWMKNEWVAAKCRAFIGLGQLTHAERCAVTEEYRRRTRKSLDDPGATQRLREFMQVFTPTGAMAIEQERRAENASLYRQLAMGAVAEPEKCRMTADAGPDEVFEYDRPHLTPSAPYPEHQHPIEKTSHTTVWQDLPDFDTF